MNEDVCHAGKNGSHDMAMIMSGKQSVLCRVFAGVERQRVFRERFRAVTSPRRKPLVK